MPVTDPISDYLTRIRNASNAKKVRVDIPASKMKVNLTEILKKQNFIRDYKIFEDNKQNLISIILRYTDGEPAIGGLKELALLV